MYMRNLALILVLFTTTLATAGQLQKGDNEVAFRFSFTDVDLGSNQGDVTNFDLAIGYGSLLTDNHELGVSAGYTKTEINGPGVDSDVDGGRWGVFYNLNFGSQGNITPYIGFDFRVFGGDLGDIFEYGYGVEAGIKVYPFDHGGFTAGLAYSKQEPSRSSQPSANTLSIGVGLALKY